MAQRLIIPGFRGSGEGHWQSYWLQDDPAARRVDQKDWEHPDRDTWLSGLITELEHNPGATLVAHSLGAVLVAGLADHPVTALIGAALLVAPCDVGRAQALHPDRLTGFDDLNFTRLSFPVIVAASRNDPYMDFERAKAWADQLGARFVDLGRAGHVNVGSGYGRWSLGADLVAMLEAGAIEPGRKNHSPAAIRKAG